MEGTNAKGRAVVVGINTGVEGVGFINNGWEWDVWGGNIAVATEAKHYPMDCVNWISEEGGGHGPTRPVPSVGKAVVSEGGGEVVAVSIAGGESAGGESGCEYEAIERWLACKESDGREGIAYPF